MFGDTPPARNKVSGIILVCLQDYANTAGWNIMQNKTEDGFWSNFDLIKYSVIWIAIWIQKKNPDFPINLL